MDVVVINFLIMVIIIITPITPTTMDVVVINYRDPCYAKSLMVLDLQVVLCWVTELNYPAWREDKNGTILGWMQGSSSKEGTVCAESMGPEPGYAEERQAGTLMPHTVTPSTWLHQSSQKYRQITKWIVSLDVLESSCSGLQRPEKKGIMRRSWNFGYSDCPWLSQSLSALGLVQMYIREESLH